MDSSEKSPKVYTELTPVMFESSEGERTDLKVPYTGTNDCQNTVDLTSVTPITNENTRSRVTFATSNTSNTFNIDSAVSAGAVNHGNDIDLPLHVAIKSETREYCSFEAEDEYCANGNDLYDNGENAIYKGLQLLFRGLPKEMFVNRILTDTASCEVKLGEMRSALFEQLKEAEDFPYGLQAMLKRRVYTWSGDSVPVKLSHDIHTLMSVIEGAEYSDMRDLLSSGGGRSQRSQSSSSAAIETISLYDFAPEIKVLTESVNSMKADILKMKQSHLAIETTRSKQIETLKSTVLCVKSDLNTLSNVVSRAVIDIRLCAERIESEKSLGVTNLKNEFRLMKGSLASIEDTIYNLETQVASGKAAVSHSGKASRKGKSCHASGNLGRSDAGSGPSAVDSGTSPDAGLNMDTQSGKTHFSFPDESHTAEPLCLVSGQQQSESSGESIAVPRVPGSVTDIVNNEAASLTEGDEGCSNQNWTENIQPQHKSLSESNMRFTVQTPTCNAPQTVSYRDAIASTGTPNHRNDTGSIITTRITRNIDSAPHNGDYYFGGSCEANGNEDDDDFVKFVKKRSKRYYLGGGLSRQ